MNRVERLLLGKPVSCLAEVSGPRHGHDLVLIDIARADLAVRDKVGELSSSPPPPPA